MSKGPLELVPIPSPIPWDGVNMSGPERTSTKVPNGLGIYGAPAPWTTSNWLQGWSARGALIKAYQWTQQNVYICPLAPHVLEAYNHKVNHDTHKKIEPPGACSVTICPVPCNMSPTAMMQGIGTDGHPRSRTSGWTLLSLSEAGPSAIWIPSHLLGNAMCPNWGTKILDYGVCDHIAHICAPFFEGIESRSQYENRRHRWEEEHRHTQMTLGDPWSPSCGPNRRTQEWDKQGPKMTKQGGRSCSESRRVQGEVDPGCQGASLLMTYQAPGIENCPCLPDPCGIK